MLGTIRADGSPRISPIEPFFVEGELLLGAMSWSAKVRDLERDPRCVVHSVVTAPHAGEHELKLYGRAVLAPAELAGRAEGAWWIATPEAARVFSVDVDRALFISWDLAGGSMTTRRWSHETGATAATRAYP